MTITPPTDWSLPDFPIFIMVASNPAAKASKTLDSPDYVRSHFNSIIRFVSFRNDLKEMEYHAYLLTLYEQEYVWFDSNRHKINESPFIDHGAIDHFITEVYNKKNIRKESFFQKNEHFEYSF